MFAFLFVAGSIHAGEFPHPVPENAQVTRLTRFNLRYSLRDLIADGVQKVEFYITDDMGATWRLYGEDADKTSPMTIEVPGEGVYGFVSVATDRFGNREREPWPGTRPETVIVVDRTAPTGNWIAPVENMLTRGNPVELKWEMFDQFFGPAPVRLQFAAGARSNRDRDAAWTTIQEGLPAAGTYSWTPPGDGAAKYNFRLLAEDRAGNVSIAYCAATVFIDSSPPRIIAVSPLKSNKLRVDITVEADDGPGGSGVKEISLYTTSNSGTTWNLVKERSDTGEMIPVMRGPGRTIPFEAEHSGDYGLWPVVFDEAGNASPIPSIGVLGQYVLVIDNEPPAVTLSSSFLGGRAAVLANESRMVEWTAYDPHVKSMSAAIHLSLDNGNTWQELAGGQATSGFTSINFPFGSHSEEARLKVTVEDDFGNVGEDVSGAFKLSGADTVISAVSPLGDTSPSSPYPDPYGSATPQYVPPPAGQTTFPSLPGFPSGDVPADPYGSGPTPVLPSGPPVNLNESTASPFPRAMTDSATGQSASLSSPFLQPPASSQASEPVYAPPAESYAPSTPQAWNPSPQTPSSPSGGVDLGFAPPSPGTGSLVPPSIPAVPTPPASVPAAPSLPPATSTSPSLDDWGSAGGIAPPPLPQSTAQASSPDIPLFGASSPGLSLEGWGGQLTPPPLAGGSAPSLSVPQPGLPSVPAEPTPLPPPTDIASTPSAAPAAPAAPAVPAPPATSSLRPPGSDVAVAPAPPQTPAAPPSSSPLFPSGPSEVAPIPPLADMSGQGASAAGQRPSDPRQLSSYYADQSKAYLDDGMVDMALESATQALNADETNPMAFAALAQAYVAQEPPNFARAATLAKEATRLGRDWYSWWTCADVFYRWAHARNTVIQAQTQSGQRSPLDLVEERNQALQNAQIAIGNTAVLVQNGPEADRDKVAVTQGEITYLRALTIPEPAKPANMDGAEGAEYRRAYAAYRTAVVPVLQEALPFFTEAFQLGGPPTYREAFRLGIVNFRLGGLERESGNLQQATLYYDSAARYLEEATVSRDVPPEGPREAYYMLAYCHDQLADQPGRDRARHKELALRYWRQTAEFYPAGTAYRTYAEQRMQTLADEMGR